MSSINSVLILIVPGTMTISGTFYSNVLNDYSLARAYIPHNMDMVQVILNMTFYVLLFV